MIALSGVLQDLVWFFLFLFFLKKKALLELQDIIKDLYVANVSFFLQSVSF